MSGDEVGDGAAATGGGMSRRAFLERFLTALVETLESTLGVDGARAFVSTAAGLAFDGDAAAEGDLAAGLEAAMNGIGGDFRVTEDRADEIVLVNFRCPFGAAVAGRDAHCALTETVLGGVAARRRGYASVELEESIAKGHPRCLVRVHLARGRPGRVFRE